MQIGCSVATRLTLLLGLAVFAASPSRAVTLEVLQGGVSVGTLDGEQLGCQSTGAVTSTCSKQNVQLGDLLLTNINLNLDTDPSISGVVAIQNLSGITQQFTLTITLLTAPQGPTTLTGGSVAGGATDNDGVADIFGNYATLSTVPGSAMYYAMIDGGLYQPLFPHSTVLNVTNPYDSADISPAGAFGTPIPSLPGPAIATSIGIRYDFSLTAQDSASFTGVFVAQPVPEPSTALLLGLGLVLMARTGRRR